MRDQDKMKDQIVNELVVLRRQIAELGASEAEHKQARETIREQKWIHQQRHRKKRNIAPSIIAMGEM